MIPQPFGTGLQHKQMQQIKMADASAHATHADLNIQAAAPGTQVSGEMWLFLDPASFIISAAFQALNKAICL